MPPSPAAVLTPCHPLPCPLLGQLRARGCPLVSEGGEKPAESCEASLQQCLVRMPGGLSVTRFGFKSPGTLPAWCVPSFLRGRRACALRAATWGRTNFVGAAAWCRWQQQDALLGGAVSPGADPRQVVCAFCPAGNWEAPGVSKPCKNRLMCKRIQRRVRSGGLDGLEKASTALAPGARAPQQRL